MIARVLLLLSAGASMLLVGSAVIAQTSRGQPNALQGFAENRGKPVRIEAASLEVRDREKLATFSGNVNVVQGDTNMRSKTLLVYYDRDDASGGVKTTMPGTEGAQQIKKLEAKGGVMVLQKDQKATGDEGIFDMRANTVTLLGNVTISKGQGQQLTGARLVVDLNSGVSRIDGGTSGAPIRATSMPARDTAPKVNNR